MMMNAVNLHKIRLGPISYMTFWYLWLNRATVRAENRTISTDKRAAALELMICLGLSRLSGTSLPCKALESQMAHTIGANVQI